LHVRAVLLGRLLQHGDTLIIQTELVDVANGSQLWGAQYNRKLADVLALQEEISRDISQNLRLRLTSAERERLTKRYTENAEAYQLYLKGRYYRNKASAEGFKKGAEYFQQAIEKDPGNALAYAGLADCYADLGTFVYLPSKEVFPKAKAAALKALEIDDSLPGTLQDHRAFPCNGILPDLADFYGSAIRRAVRVGVRHSRPSLA
jgi:tetratricopeptide (TPR) repeat protein